MNRHAKPDGLSDLSPLIRAVRAPATTQELRGEAPVLAAYRATMARTRTRRGGLRVLSGTGMTVAASGLVLSMTAVTAAAYTSVLPHAVQREAHRLFHRVGVPAPRPEHRVPTDDATAAGRLGGHPGLQAGQAGVPGRSLGHSPESPYRLTVQAAAVTRLGSSVRVGLHVLRTRQTEPLPTVATLLGRTPGSAAWSLVGRTRLDAGGGATVTVRHLTHTMQLQWRLVVPHGTSLLSRVTVVLAQPALTEVLSTTSAPVGNAVTLSATSDPTLHGRPVALQQLVLGRWQELAESPVDRTGHATFSLDTRRRGTVTYRCVLTGSALYATALGTPLNLTLR